MAKATKAEKTLSYRQSASLKLAQLYRCAGVMRASGEIVDAGPWLKVLANLLSAAPAGPIGKRRGRHAPDRWELSYTTLLVAAERCGLEVSEDEIEQQVLETGAWRHKESQRIGREHYAQMRADKIGELLGITEEIRREAEAWNIGTFGGSPNARAEAARERHRLRDERRRRDEGATPRSESLNRAKPWESAGVSRATWYRRQGKEGAHPPDDDPPDGASKADLRRVPERQIRGAGVRQFPVRLIPERQISDPETVSCETIIPHGPSPRECPDQPPSGEVEREKTATIGRGEPEVDANPIGAGADRQQEIEAAIARFRLIKGQPTPPYQIQPGGIAARALVDAMETQHP